MLVYVVYDKTTGKVVLVHRAVDSEGRSLACSDEEVLSVLPEEIDRSRVGITPTDFAEIPSGRVLDLSVEVATGAVVRTPVKAEQSKRK